MIITIDGYSVTGKSTMAKLLAKQLNYIHINSGLLYRYISYQLIKKGISKQDNPETYISLIKETLNDIVPDINYIEKLELKTLEISAIGTKIAEITIVRNFVNKIIYKIANDNNIVIDGRDTGTYLFPDANVKFFFIANINIRAKRLSKDVANKNIKSLMQEIQHRDNEDAKRLIAPLKKSKNAIIIDTSNNTIKEVLKELDKHINVKK